MQPARRCHRSPVRTLLSAALLSAALATAAVTAGCGSDSEAAVDAATSAADGSPADPDGAVTDAASSNPDATPDSADAEPGDDSGSSADLDALCTDLCGHMDTCDGVDDVPACIAECKTELADCEDGALSAVDNCMNIPCPGFDTCMGTIPCANN